MTEQVPVDQKVRLATERQVRLLGYLCSRHRIGEDGLCQKFGIPHISAMPFSEVNRAIDWITGVDPQ